VLLLQDSVRWENEVTGAEEKACGVQKSVALTDADSASTGGSGRGAEQTRAEQEPDQPLEMETTLLLSLSRSRVERGEWETYRAINKNISRINNILIFKKYKTPKNYIYFNVTL